MTKSLHRNKASYSFTERSSHIFFAQRNFHVTYVLRIAYVTLGDNFAFDAIAITHTWPATVKYFEQSRKALRKSTNQSRKMLPCPTLRDNLAWMLATQNTGMC